MTDKLKYKYNSSPMCPHCDAWLDADMPPVVEDQKVNLSCTTCEKPYTAWCQVQYSTEPVFEEQED